MLGFYISLMSARMFHSRDLAGLREALTEESGTTCARDVPKRT